MLHNFKLHAIFQRAEFNNLYFLGVWMDDTEHWTSTRITEAC